MDIERLEAQLAEAQSRLEKAAEKFLSSHNLEDWDKLPAMREELLATERELALAKHEETALSCEWEVPWSGGAPLPHVVSSGQKAFLVYLMSKPDPNWDGTYITIVDAASSSSFPLALVEFVGCYAFKFGGPNDEVFHGHPLSGKGLGGYRAYLIANSQWLAELERINSVHDAYDPSYWRELKHYMLLFHDEMFECIAASHKIELHKGTFEQVLEIASKRLFE
jgi:hypothetical protein